MIYENSEPRLMWIMTLFINTYTFIYYEDELNLSVDL